MVYDFIFRLKKEKLIKGIQSNVHCLFELVKMNKEIPSDGFVKKKCHGKNRMWNI